MAPPAPALTHAEALAIAERLIQGFPANLWAYTGIDAGSATPLVDSINWSTTAKASPFVNDMYLDAVHDRLYICTVAGSYNKFVALS